VWQKLGDGAGGHKDTLGNPFAPFAFGSKYGLREVARDEALLLGVIKPTDDPIKAMVRAYMKRNWAPLEKELGKMGDHEPRAVVPRVVSKAEAAGLDPDLIRAMKKSLAVQEDGTIRLRREMDKELAAADAAYKARSAMRNRAVLHDAILNSGTSLGALLGWITRRLGKMQAARAFDRVHTRKGGMRGKIGHPIQYKKVDSGEAARIKAATGLDVAGFHHSLDDSSLRHIHKRHGDVRNE
jgi:hypothetical protein